MYYILTKQYSDKSGFYVYGLTQQRTVAKAWVIDSDDHFAYMVKVDDIQQHPAFEI